MSDELRTPTQIWLDWLPEWWQAIRGEVDRLVPDCQPQSLDQSEALHRDAWDALGVDPSDPKQRHALAVGLAYGARYVIGDSMAAGTLIPLRTGWGDLGGAA